MKLPFILALTASHIAAGSIGWLAFHSVSGLPEPSDDKVETPKPRETQRQILGAPTSPNPIFRATSSDFRDAWMQQLRQSGHPDIGLFLDWCEVDPEAAILGLQHIWAPEFQHNYLANATHGSLAATLAEPLVIHWQKFSQLPTSKLSYPLALSLRALAKEDPERSCDLLFMLPSEMRENVYGSLFKSIDVPRLMIMAEKIKSHEISTPEETNKMWYSLISAINQQSTVSETLDLSPAFNSDEAMATLGPILINKATRFDQWNALVSHPQLAKRNSPLRQGLEKSLHRTYQGRHSLLPALEACAKTDDWSLLENLPTPVIPSHLRVKKSPDEYLKWLSTHQDNSNQGTATRVAIRLAINASLRDTLNWISEQPAGRSRDLAHVEAVKAIARNKSQDSSLASQLAAAIQDKSLRAEADQVLTP
ncbi:hypothetical protein NT6N_14710 [Oceaniferula spumae]|uniref:Uncharacterized protein n=1 Tax=Oceaniferula spumae TaxID=2979115 RepID=A0AAT9FK95_9BACT